MRVCVGVCCVCAGCGGVGVVRILQSLIGVIRYNWSSKNQNPPIPTPSLRWWIMTGPHLIIDSYIFFTLLFYLLIYLFIFKFFFSLGESNRRNYFTWHIWCQFQSNFALYSFGWGSVSCSIVRWKRSGSYLTEGWVTCEEHGTQQFNIGHVRGD